MNSVNRLNKLADKFEYKLRKNASLRRFLVKISGSPELLALKNNPIGDKLNQNLWFDIPNMRRTFEELLESPDNFFDSKVKKVIAENKGFTEPVIINDYYFNHAKITDLSRFICSSFDRHFPHLKSSTVLNNLNNVKNSNYYLFPINFIIHDLIHQVIEPDFIDQLQKQKPEEGVKVISLSDQLNEELAGTLSNVQSNFLKTHIKKVFNEKYKEKVCANNSLNYSEEELKNPLLKEEKFQQQLNALKDVIELTFHIVKAELRGKLNKVAPELDPLYLKKVKKISPEFKQLVDGTLSKLKHAMLNQAENVLRAQIRPNKKFTDIKITLNIFSSSEDGEINNIFEQYLDNIVESSIIEQSNSSALRSWMIECLSKMNETLNYFKNST
jgi:hypothetical protein